MSILSIHAIRMVTLCLRLTGDSLQERHAKTFLRFGYGRAMSVATRARSDCGQVDRAHHSNSGSGHHALRRAPARDRRHFAKNVDANAAQSGARRPRAAHGPSGRSAKSGIRAHEIGSDIDRSTARSLPLVGKTSSRAASEPGSRKSESVGFASFRIVLTSCIVSLFVVTGLRSLTRRGERLTEPWLHDPIVSRLRCIFGCGLHPAIRRPNADRRSLMHQAEIIVLLFAAVWSLVLVARNLGLPYPVVLVLAGLALSFIPHLPEVKLDPNLVFFFFLPPLIYPAALFTSWRDFRRNLRPILLLAIGLVLFTTITIACVAHSIVPSLPWAAAFALGAIVSPPDAIAATSVIRRLSVPHRIEAILEGESLVNDATALVALQFAF